MVLTDKQTNKQKNNPVNEIPRIYFAYFVHFVHLQNKNSFHFDFFPLSIIIHIQTDTGRDYNQAGRQSNLT